MHVLYVEDSPADAELTLRELRAAAADIELEVVPSVGEALARLDAIEAAIARGRDSPCDLVLLDLHLPDGGGLDVLAEVRRRALPLAVVVLTASGDEQSAISALRAGADDYLTKRRDYWTLLPATLRSALDNFRSQAARHARPLKLLYAEPNEHDVALTRRHLAEHAPFVHLQVVRSAEEALERLPACGPAGEVDVLLLDYRLPGMTALEALKEIREARALDVPVVITTGQGTEEVAVQALKLGAADYIVKSPGYLHRLPAAVEAAFYRAQAARENAALLRRERELRESELKFRELIEQASDGIFVSDAQGRLLLVNSRYCEMVGYSEAELLRMNVADTYPPQDTSRFSEKAAKLRERGSIVFERTMMRRDGVRFPVEVSVRLLTNNTYQGIVRDITERKEQEKRIARLTRIHAVLSGINSAIVRIRDRQELFQQACRIIVEQGGFSVGWIAALDPASGTLVPLAQAGLPIDLGIGSASTEQPSGFKPAGVAEVALRTGRPAFENDLTAGPESTQAPAGPDTLSIRRSAVRLGARSVIVLPLFVEGQTFGVLTLYAPERDFFDEEEVKLLTELAGDISFGLSFIAKEEKVHYLAYYDALTGLANRTLLLDRLGQCLRTAQREQRMAALVLADLERFHVVNDTLGRSAGDACLSEIATRLRQHVRAEDTIARVGADCFAVALLNVGSADEVAHLLHDRVSAFVRQPIVLSGQELRPSARFGVAMYPSDGDSPETLYANAEAALKRAKSTGERFLFYTPEMNARIAESLVLENKLRAALERDQFVLHYQPKVSVRDRRITGLEALIRWNDPEIGLVSPAKFIPLLESTGLIREVGRWALKQVARDCRLWAAKGIKPARVAVNVSPIELRQKDFVDTMVEAVRAIQDAGGMLDLEITESVIMDNVEAITGKLRTLRGLGMEIAVDDFGTGYSSLAYIARLPIHALKIDRSFIVGMTHSADSLAIVTSVISLARSLRLQVVAEGVETREQVALLGRLGCDQMQGYFISQPVPAEEVARLLAEEFREERRSVRRKTVVATRKSRSGRGKRKRR